MADLLSRLPDLSDVELATLRGIAERVSRKANDRQGKAAAELLPAVLAEIAKRPAKRSTARRRQS
jgi:hypothetical protein